MHILFVDDEEIKITSVITELKKLGVDFTYDTAKSMSTGALYIKEATPDLVVLDMGLPSFDNEPVLDNSFGLQLVNDIKKHSPDCHIIIYSQTYAPVNFIKNKKKQGVSIEQITKINPFSVAKRIEQIMIDAKR